MSILWAVLAFLVIFSVLVVAHESGHLIVAKANGIRVREFAIGMGPKLLKFRKKGTDYVLRALPFGGACVFEDDDPFENEEEEEVREENPMTDSLSSDDKGFEKKKRDASKEEEFDEEEEAEGKYGKKFSQAPLAGRIATVLAGPVFNVLLGFLLAMVVVGFCGEHTTVIGGLMEGMPAEAAGMQPGDEIISINGQRIHLFDEITLFTITSRSDEWVVKYKRGDEYYTANIKLQEANGGKYMGVVASEPIDCANFRIFEYSWYELRYWLVASVKSVGMLFSGRISKDDVAGPVGMTQVIGNTIQETKAYGLPTVIINLVNIALLLSVNLAVMNLLPLPALDGGRFIFLLVELVIRRQVPKKFEAIVTFVGFSALFLLMIFVLVNDVSKFFR